MQLPSGTPATRKYPLRVQYRYSVWQIAGIIDFIAGSVYICMEPEMDLLRFIQLSWEWWGLLSLSKCDPFCICSDIMLVSKLEVLPQPNTRIVPFWFHQESLEMMPRVEQIRPRMQILRLKTFATFPFCVLWRRYFKWPISAHSGFYLSVEDKNSQSHGEASFCLPDDGI